MNMYQEFAKAVNESENERVKSNGRALIGTCQKYYSAYVQYQELAKINNWFSQVYYTEEAIDKKQLDMVVKLAKLSVLDRQMLNFLVEHRKNLVEVECAKERENIDVKKMERKGLYKDKDRTDQLEDEIEEHKAKISQLKKSTLDCLLFYMNSREAKYTIQELMDGQTGRQYPELGKMMINAVNNYRKVLNSRLGYSAKSIQEYRSVIRQSDIKLDEIDKMVEIYIKNKTEINFSKEEAFNYVFKEEFVSELIDMIHNFSNGLLAAHFSFATSPVLSRLTYKEIKRESSDDYFKKKFRFNLDTLQEKIKMMRVNYGVVFDPYIQNREKLKNALDYGKVSADYYCNYEQV